MSLCVIPLSTSVTMDNVCREALFAVMDPQIVLMEVMKMAVVSMKKSIIKHFP